MNIYILSSVVILVLIGQEIHCQGGKDIIMTDFPGQEMPSPNFSGEHPSSMDQRSPLSNLTDENILFENENEFASTLMFDKELSTEVSEQDPWSDNFSDKHPKFRECSAIVLDPEDFVIFDNGTAYVPVYNRTYNSSFYYLHETGMLSVCPELEDFQQNNSTVINSNIRSHLVFYYLTRICLSISILCLFLHLIVFCIVPDIRNLPGYCMASLCVSLLSFYALFIVSDIDEIESSLVTCKVMATLAYFFILSAFMWMATLSYDVFRSLLKATGKLRLSSNRFAKKRYLSYSLFSWGTSLIFVATASVMDNVEGISDEYRPLFGEVGCWFGTRTALLILFGGPVFVIIAINIVFFICSAYIIYTNRMKTEEVAYRAVLRDNFKLHYRLATIMGLTWVLGVANTSSSFWLLSLYVLFSSLQGFFIFLACTCTAKVRRRLKEMLKMRDRKISTISTTATFQSYCTQDFLVGREIYTITKSNGNLNMA